jgi:RNA polymerase sigma-70 factor (ECF subfamily)
VSLSFTRWTEIGRAQEGDREAWERLSQKYRPPVAAFFASRGLAAEADDLAQEVFVELLQRRILGRAERDKGRFRNLLFGVARNVGMRHLAKRGKAWRGGPAVQALGEAQVPAPSPEEASLFAREWTLNLLDLALARLKRDYPHYHRAVHGYFLGGRSQGSIAAEEGRKAADVANHVARGKQKLLSFLREEAWATCRDGAEFEEEMALLREALARTPRP